jgi:SAM-dependent methyltransferase
MNVSPDRLPTPFDDGALYDLFLEHIPYGFEFYTDLAKSAGGPVLDVCCGTGRILLPCLQAGIDIEGLDLYPPMLDRLRQKAAPLGLSPRLHHADMSDFNLPRRYALVVIPFNAFGHNVTQDAQIRCLSLCRQHLAPGGRLAFDTFFPSLAVLGAPQNVRVLEGEMPHPSTGEPMRMYDTRRFDRIAQIQHSITEFEVPGADGGVHVHRTEVSLRYIFRNEMELLLRIAGFARFDIHGDFDRRPLTREDDAMIVEAWND